MYANQQVWHIKIDSTVCYVINNAGSGKCELTNLFQTEGKHSTAALDSVKYLLILFYLRLKHVNLF